MAVSSGSLACQVEVSGEHITIHTTPRRSEAILMVLAGATLQEVGDHLGISRERVRQYVEQAGLSTSMRPVQRGQTQEEAKFFRASPTKRRARRRERLRQRYAKAVAFIREFYLAEIRPPTHAELYAHLFGRAPRTGSGTPQLMVHFGHRAWKDKSRQGGRRIRLAYDAAGVPRSALGYFGHRDGGMAVRAGMSKRSRAYWSAMTPTERRAEVARRVGRS